MSQQIKYLEDAENLQSMEKRSKDSSSDNRRDHETPDRHPVHRSLCICLCWLSEERHGREKRDEERYCHRNCRHTLIGQEVLCRCLLLSTGAGVVDSNGGGNGEDDG